MEERQMHPASLANLEKGTKDRQEAREAKKELFLRALLEKWPNVAEAAKEAGWSRTEAYVERQRDERYRQAWDEIIEAKMDKAENRLFDAGLNDRGMVNLLIPMLKAYRKGTYGDKIEHSGSVSNVQLTVSPGLGAPPVQAETPATVGEGGRKGGQSTAE